MDKYTYSLKADKIQKLVRQEDYLTAAKIADTMEWKQERSVRLLTAAAEAYEKTGQYKTATDLLLAAYEQAAVGKRILYNLTELAIKRGSMEEAETFYKKYLEEAAEENNRYILRYLIADAKGESLDKRISILEAYRKHEFEEKWACCLAELYQEAGREKECVALCDEIILWFGVGKYVDRAMELKEMYQPLTDSQREHRENRAYYEEKVRKVAREMEEALERPLEDESEETAENPAEPEPIQGGTKPAEDGTKPETTPESESPAESAGDDLEEVPIPEIAISQEAAAFDEEPEKSRENSEEEPDEKPERSRENPEEESGEKPEQSREIPGEEPDEEPEQSREIPDEESGEEPEAVRESAEESAAESSEEAEAVGTPEEPAAAESADGSEEMFEEDAEEEPADPDQTKRLNLYAPLRGPKLQGPEELAKTQEVILPSRLRENPQVKHVVLETSAASDEEAGSLAEAKKPETPSAAEMQEEAVQEAAGGKGENPAPAETAAGSAPEEGLNELAEDESAKDEPLPLEKDANVLPVLSYEETEKAVWEDQNRRMEEREPLEIHEMEHCIFVSAANSAEGVNKAVEALGEHYRKENRELSAIAKITGEKLNRRGLVRSLPQLKKKDLIIDEAGKLDDRIIAEMLEILEYLDPEKVFVLLETPAETESLRQRVRSQIIEAEKTRSMPAEKPEEEELPKIQLTQTEEAVNEAREAEQKSAGSSEPERRKEKAENRPNEKGGAKRVLFANLSEDQVLSEKDFLRYAEYFARELECSIDPSGMDAIEAEGRLIRQEGGRLTVGEAEAIVEDAAEHAEKHTLKRLFVAKYDKEGYLILRKRDFA